MHLECELSRQLFVHSYILITSTTQKRTKRKNLHEKDIYFSYSASEY